MAAILVRWIVLGIAVAVASWLFGGVEVDGGFWSYAWVAAILGLVNALVKPVAIILTLPLTLLTLGLFLIVLNAAMLGLTDWLTGSFSVDGFWTAVFASIVISIVSWVLNGALGTDRDRDQW
ncbi:MAG TPA: phage holin family protein [Acidimicrobiales bacterium]|nr:phage holin family protein [Acidimicrobiales bacterium]